MDQQLRILLVEDQVADAELLEHELRRGGFQFSARRVDTQEAFEAALVEFKPDLILSDFSMPSFDGLAALDLAQASAPHVPFIFISGTIGEDRAIEALKRGATDYVLKDRPKRIVSAIERALDEAKKRAVLKKQEEKLNYLAWFDPLTGLPNRALIQERLSRTLDDAAKTGVTLVVWNLNRFGIVNESLGRQAGDVVLRELGNRFASAWPNPEHVARLGSDSFAGFVAGKDGASAAFLLEQFTRQVLGPSVSAGGKDLTVSMAAGIATYPGDGASADTLFRNAEAALKQAKASSSRYMFYQPAMNATVTETLVLESKLRRALEHREFALHYQPKVDLATGKLAGVEALLRWNDPGTGMVPPIRFIPLLEETGLIIEVGQWTLRQALEDWRKWRDEGLPAPRIAVNVSAIQVAQQDFLDMLRREIERCGGQHGLDLEITESLLMQDIEGNIAKLRVLQEMGVQIAVDDFGTGYSSLRYLAQLPINALKIDRSFVITMADEANGMAIASTIISLGHALNLKIIAEGVETEDQLRLLKLLKCEQAQGYLYHNPMPAEKLRELLR